ncbi:MAG: hypothetical protein HOL56_06075 [Flavobacteriales bacterium]|jgi:hypothetical protein|nr:hypothetical protein [Flavobacteriales bacterium]MBT5699552.1 hypothetical protein [Flavobacteriales bacterium]
MKRILFIFTTLLSTLSFSQIIFSPEVEISNHFTGYGRPRMALMANDMPIIIWFNEVSNQTIKISRQIPQGIFTPPVDIVGSDLEPIGFIGPEIAAKGDTVYITFICGIANNSIMIKKSFDGGLTFSDTIRVSPNDNNFQYYMPNIEVKDDGNPIVSYMKCTHNDTDFEQIVNISMDFGSTFDNEVNASELAPGEPCDCCKSTIVTKGNNVYLLFRNNEVNVRNTYISKSTDGGISFTATQDLDDLNWTINACPTSSPNGVLNGDSILVASRSGATGVNQVYYSNVNSNNLQKNYYRTIDEIGSGLQDQVEVAGEGNILGIVWHDNRNMNNACYLSYTIDGTNNIGGSIEMSNSMIGHKKFPDIEYSNGKFYFVYQYNSGYSIVYKELDLSNINNLNLPTTSSNSIVISTTDFQGKRCKLQKNMPYLNIYQDGRVEKRVTIE